MYFLDIILFLGQILMANNEDWENVRYLTKNYTIGQGLIDGGYIDITFYCPKCNFKHEESCKIDPPFLGADTVRDSEREHYLDTIYCDCAEEFEITIFNNMSDIYVDFDGTSQPDKYWFNLRHPKEYLLIEDLENDDIFINEQKERIISIFKSILPEIKILLNFDNNDSDLHEFLYSITKFLVKERVLDEKYFLEINQNVNEEKIEYFKKNKNKNKFR